MDVVKLQELRDKIDSLDKTLVKTLQERFQVASEIADLKKAANLPALDQTRWQQVLESKKELAKTLGLSPDFIATLYDLIHEEALRQEDLIIKSE